MNVFLGTYREIFDAAHEVLGIELVIAEDKPSSADVLETAASNGIETRVVGTHGAWIDALPDSVDTAVVMGFGRRIPSDAIARCGTVVNFHPGIVEINRGRHGLLISALQGHDMMGITCHLIEDEEIDAGPIVAQLRLPIDYDANFDANHARLRHALHPFAADIFNAANKAGRWHAVSWPSREAPYFPPLNEAEMKAVFDARRLGDIRGKTRADAK